MKTRFLLLPLCLAVVGCSSDEEQTVKTQADYDDVATAVGSTVSKDGGGDAAAISDSTELALGVTPLGFSLTGAGTFQGDRLGVSYSYALSCKDAAGNAMAECGAATDEVTADVAWSGDLDLPRFTTSVDRDGSWTVTGLQGDVATLDGDGEFHFDAVVRPANGEERSYRLDYAADYQGILVRMDDHLLIGGSAAYDVSAERLVGDAVEARFTMEARISFAADGTATLVLDGAQSYRVDTRTGVVVHL